MADPTVMHALDDTPLPHGKIITHVSVANVAAAEKLFAAIPAGTGWVHVQSDVECYGMIDPTGSTAFAITTAFRVPSKGSPIVLPVHSIAGTGRVILSTNGGSNLSFVSVGYEKGDV